MTPFDSDESMVTVNPHAERLVRIQHDKLNSRLNKYVYIPNQLWYNASMKTFKLLEQVAILEDIERNNEGLDTKVLVEAVSVTEFSEPVDAEILLVQLIHEGLI